MEDIAKALDVLERLAETMFHSEPKLRLAQYGTLRAIVADIEEHANDRAGELPIGNIRCILSDLKGQLHQLVGLENPSEFGEQQEFVSLLGAIGKLRMDTCFACGHSAAKK